jgi:hypothetical protein
MGMVNAFTPAMLLLLFVEPIVGEHSNARGDNTGKQMSQ